MGQMAWNPPVRDLWIFAFLTVTFGRFNYNYCQKSLAELEKKLNFSFFCGGGGHAATTFCLPRAASCSSLVIVSLHNRTGEERRHRRQTLCDKHDNNFFLLFLFFVKEGFVSDPHFFLSFNVLIKLISEINSKGWLEEFYLFYRHIYKNKLSSYNGNQQLLAWILTV